MTSPIPSGTLAGMRVMAALPAVFLLAAGCATSGRSAPSRPRASEAEAGGLPPGHPPSGGGTRPSEGSRPPGHPSTEGRELPPGHPPVADDPRLAEPGPMAEAWRRPFVLLDGESGRRIDPAGLDARIRAARVIYVGEKHDDLAHHQVELELLARAARLGSVALGLEMVERPRQSALDRFLADGDEAALLEGTAWEERWGYDFRMYRPLFLFASESGLGLVALNARRELVRAVATEGVDGLGAELSAELPELDLDDSAHRARLRLVWADHGAGHGGRFEGFYAAQVTWDETMAATVAAALEGEAAPDRLVVVAGAGHVRYGEGIPSRAARRGAGPGLTVLPVEREDAVQLVGSGVADVLWVFDGFGETGGAVADRR